MRPIRLKLAGLHSYREVQEVDFEKLCEAGLFGIFGPTGSGKSTILDAITLALYGQVVRFGGGTHPKDVLNQLEQRVFVSFAFEIGHEDERRRYTIEREFGVDKKGNRRQPEVRLIQNGRQPGEPDVVLESKASSATAAIESLIGLTLQDFTRAVVLPQGQFSRFLTLKGSERNEMLQRMFGLHIYGEKLNERVRAAMDEVKTEIHRLQLELAALGDVGPDALDAARKTLDEAKQQEREYSEQMHMMQQQRKEMEQLHQWQQELAAVRERMARLSARNEEIAALTARIRELEHALALWPLKQKWQQIQTAWQAAAEILKRCREEQEAAVQAEQEAEQTYLQVQTRLQREEPLLIEQKSGLVQALEWEKELAVLQEELSRMEQELLATGRELEQVTVQLKRDEDQAAALEREYSELAKHIQAATVTPELRLQIAEAREAKRNWEREWTRLKELEQESIVAKQERIRLHTEAEQLKAAWLASAQAGEQARQKLADHEAKPSWSDADWEQMRETLVQIRQWGKEWREQLALEAACREKRAKWESEWNLVTAKTTGLEQAWKEAEQLRSERLQQVETARRSWQDWQQANMARVLCRELAEGQECPVCGSTHHPHQTTGAEAEEAQEHAGDLLLQQLRRSEEALQAAEQQVRHASEALQASKLERAALEQRQQALTEEQQIIQRRIDEVRSQCAALGPQWQVSDIRQLLEMYQQAEQQWKRQGEEREQARLLHEQLLQECSKLRERELEQKGAYERKAVLLEQQEEKLSDLRIRLEAAQQQVKQAEEALHQLRGEWAVEEIETEYQAIGEKDRQLEQLHRLRAEKETVRIRLLEAVESARNKRTELSSRMQALAERKEEKNQQWQKKHSLWLERTGGQPAETRMQTVEATLRSLRDALQQAEVLRRQTAAVRQQAQEAVVKHTEAYAALSRQQEEAHRELLEAAANSGIGTMDRIEQLYQERGELPLYRQQVQEHEAAQAQAQYDEQRLTQALAGRQVSEEQWHAARHAWNELEQTFQAVKDRVAVARQTLARIEDHHDKWQQLQQQLADVLDEQSRLEDLKKLFEGKAFVQFIAEEKLASIARDASYHLKRMTKNRYALELGDDGEFVLRDEAAGGLRRAVSTLSGGETFLTSLSLALALSVEIQMRGGRLEFFFLDEGFGTLDPELLEIVLDALERLRMNHFTIGVISHVPDMRMRMPRRLIVTPAEPLGAGSRVHLEMES